ncbi:MAG TPA: NUDIX hydrolase [Planctomycetota bacterium]|nr:NUDIX hydrolase [Planctomycetota bacterium]
MSEQSQGPILPRTMSSSEVYAGRAFRVREDVIEAGGRRMNRQVVVHPGAAAVLPVLPDGRAVLVRQYRHALATRLLEIPAGTLEPGEPPEACARREIEEEAGYRVGRIAPLGPVYPAPGISTEIIHLFAATDLSETPARPEPDEDIEVELHPLEEVVRMIADGRICDGKTVTAVARWQWRVAR